MKDEYDGLAQRSIIGTALVLFVILGSGCGSKPAPTVSPKAEPAQQAESVKTEEPLRAKAMVECYQEHQNILFDEASLDVRENGLNQVEDLVNQGWELRMWCIDRESSSGARYAFAFRKSGVTDEDLAAVEVAYAESGVVTSPKIKSSDVNGTNGWGILKLAYLAPEKNRQNGRTLVISNPIAVNGGSASVGDMTSLSFIRDLSESFEFPRSVAAETRGGDDRNFSARIIFHPITREISTDAFCRTSLEGTREEVGMEFPNVVTRCE